MKHECAQYSFFDDSNLGAMETKLATEICKLMRDVKQEPPADLCRIGEKVDHRRRTRF